MQKQLHKAQAELQAVKHIEDSLLKKIETLKYGVIKEQLYALGMPLLKQGDEVVCHSAYCLVYEEQHEQARWVAHIILPEVEFGSEGRSNDFRPDSAVKTGSSIEQDYFVVQTIDGVKKYKGYGYDRGHLAPSADFRWSKKALSESYYYSNMSPQVGPLNRESWANLEDAMRYYVIKHKVPLYVVTGPVLRNDLKKIPEAVNKVSVPDIYYKVVLDTVNRRGIAFMMENKKNEYPLMSYAVTIDSVEKYTGIDFFPKLVDTAEARIEKNMDINKWVGEREQDDVLPVPVEELPKYTFNTVQAKIYMDKGEDVKVCGTVVSTKLSSKGNIFLNLDKKFPNQIFTVTIFKDYTSNFSYQPDKELFKKKVIVKGKISNFKGTPSMNIQNEDDIKILE
ncbi:MAG: DNA/RNA non-specific endonuclease [Cytophagales bacterium]|nr:DNA/RNA non-specific endonuclease [Cytophagales bacterium]